MEEKQRGSVGVIQPQRMDIDEPLKLDGGQTLATFSLVYETYGELNADRTNAVLICHALSGDHHAAGRYSSEDRKAGWWDLHIGPGKSIDTDRFFVVALNNIGGCSGSSGPNTINPNTGQLWGPDFPIVTIQDWVRSQHMFSQRLGIARWAAIVGGSMGGMQALQWSIMYPDMLANAVILASSPYVSAQNIAFNEVARNAILRDPAFHGGWYYEKNEVPANGLAVARMLGHITYLSDEAMEDKFSRAQKSDQLGFAYEPDFEVESYLQYQGLSFTKRFDANTYLLMTRMLDYFDPAVEHGSLTKAVSHADCRFFLASFSSDWRFPPRRSEMIVQALIEAGKRVSYVEIESPHGHDSFLMDIEAYNRAFRAYMEGVADEC